MHSHTTVSRRSLLRAVGAGLAAGLAGCTGGSSDGGAGGSTGGTETGTAADTDATTTGGVAGDWRRVELTDVRTGETFTVASLADRPVLLEFFAVWCPVCTEQQRAMAELAGRRDDVVPVSLNTDPNEDARTVREHAESKGFDWRYAVAPTGMTRALVEQFGSVITSPPSAPVVRTCPGGDAALLEGRGVKSAGALADAVEAC